MNYIETAADILKLPEQHSVIGKRFELTVLDHFHIGLYTRFALVFENKHAKDVDVTRLKQSLIETLIEYPELTGCLEISERVSLLHSNNGVTFSVFKSYNISYEDLLSMSRKDTEIFYASKLSFDLSDQYLGHIRLSILKDNSYIMAFSISHVLQDAHSIFQFVNAWSYRYLHRELDARDFESFKNCNFNERNRLKGHKQTDHCEQYRIAKGDSFWNRNVVFKSTIVTVSKKKLKILKEEYLKWKTSEHPPFISCNDIMCAILFKAITKSKQISKNTQVKFGQIKNFRKIFGLSDQFSGIATIATGFSLTADQIESIAWWELSALMRNNLNSLSAVKIKGILGYLESPKDWNDVRSAFNNSVDTFFVNWESFPIFESDFGHGNPEKLLYSDWWLGLVVFLPVLVSGYTEVILNLTEEESHNVLNDSLVKDIMIC